MFVELMNENARIRAENVMLRKVVFALIAQGVAEEALAATEAKP